MICDNTQVKHKTFGLGTVTVMSPKYFSVCFADGVKKSFVYPDAFEKFLTLEDGSVSEEILADLAVSRAKKQSVKDKKVQENLHSMMHGIVIPGKETSGDNDDEESSDKSVDTEEV